jgi:heme exporter protein D
MIDFFQQGGYAGYVWGSFGMTAVLLLIEIVQLRGSRHTILTRLSRLARVRGPRRNAPAGTTDSRPEKATAKP